MVKKERYVRPVIEVITGAETQMLAGSTGVSDKMAGDKDNTSGTGSNPTSSTGEANGNLNGGIAGKIFGAKGWAPVGMDVLDSLNASW